MSPAPYPPKLPIRSITIALSRAPKGLALCFANHLTTPPSARPVAEDKGTASIRSSVSSPPSITKKKHRPKANIYCFPSTSTCHFLHLDSEEAYSHLQLLGPLDNNPQSRQSQFATAAVFKLRLLLSNPSSLTKPPHELSPQQWARKAFTTSRRKCYSSDSLSVEGWTSIICASYQFKALSHRRRMRLELCDWLNVVLVEIHCTNLLLCAQ